MINSVAFIITNVMLGVGLAMDAFSVSIANGLADPKMKKGRTWLIAGTFSFYQFLMPMIGWVCVHYLAEKFEAFQKFIPWIALILLGFIGGKMLFEGIHDLKEQKSAKENETSEQPNTNIPADGVALSFGMLMVQGIATSIDALSVGFTIAEYNALAAFIASLIIAIVTLIICLFGIKLGRLAGDKLSTKATIFGGIILILIGIEVFITNMF